MGMSLDERDIYILQSFKNKRSLICVLSQILNLPVQNPFPEPGHLFVVRDPQKDKNAKEQQQCRESHALALSTHARSLLAKDVVTLYNSKHKNVSVYTYVYPT